MEYFLAVGCGLAPSRTSQPSPSSQSSNAVAAKLFSYFSFPPQRFNYVDKIGTSVDDFVHQSKTQGVEGWGCPRVDVNMSELRSQDNGSLSQRLRRDPLPHIRALEAACHDIAMEERPGYDKNGTSNKLFKIYCTII